jgi:alcohol dehydrogenase (cytochrome c)
MHLILPQLPLAERRRRVRHVRGAALLLALLAAQSGACARPEQAESPAPRGGDTAVAVRAAAGGDDDGQWLRPAKDYASTRYSGLADITTANVSRLRLAWTFSTGKLRGHEAAPIVAGSTMYLVTPHPNVVFALDLARGGSQKWKYEAPVALAAAGVACCDVVNRGVVYDAGRIFFNTLDAQTIALDAETGRELWRTPLGDINKGETMTMAPLVVKGLVLVGNSGGELGVRGWLKALDANTGAVRWTAYSTGSDADVRIGPDFRPFYADHRGRDLGLSTWTAEQWKLGGGTVWGWISYDPELDLIYYGTGNPGVWNPALRPGDNKWSVTLFARRPVDGRAVWAYQMVPHDEHDYDGVNESVLLDLEVGGRVRKVLVRPERTGFMYVVDRATGEVLSADKFGPVNWATHVDLRTGRPAKDESKATGNRMARDVCPAAPGLKDWQPSAWSPRTRLLYVPHNNICMDYEGTEANYIAGTPYVGANVVMHAANGDSNRGMFTAWDPVARRAAWKIPELFPVWSGAVVTAGDVVFYGTMDRWFKAVDARTGRLLWQHRAGSGIIGQPVTYRGPDGKQYVAVLSGVGGWAGAAALGLLPEQDPTIALGFAHAVRDLPDHTPQGGMLYVFALP